MKKRSSSTSVGSMPSRKFLLRSEKVKCTNFREEPIYKIFYTVLYGESKKILPEKSLSCEDKEFILEKALKLAMRCSRLGEDWLKLSFSTPGEILVKRSWKYQK